jgi:uncharacterized membrane protein
MARTLLYLLSGLLLGVAIHLLVILTLPSISTSGISARIADVGEVGQLVTLDTPGPGEANPMRLDPNLSYAVCRLDLSKGPGVVSGTLPQASWSVAVYNRNGTVIYSTTNRDGIGQTLDLGIFNATQTRLLAEQQIDVEQGLLIVESPNDDIFVAVRLAAPEPVMRERYRAQLGKLACGNISL